MEGKLCKLPVESQRIYSLFTFYIFTKPDLKDLMAGIPWKQYAKQSVFC